ncbi:MAG: hypothetical protein KDI38_03140 [Calditrichaeota bacterium]|nr:hypothetical protein [Calditrichota bacterium]MCB0297424.1 hypothetical protein [Calditrichota bacterium]MCB0302754.1 hypothetical protein [Calditrichota bacterium]MCB0312901.1 hypothetical protein [Calditrichota bacterium]MCB9088903.1 hypothetical protein [Calditrichia bacterium]
MTFSGNHHKKTVLIDVDGVLRDFIGSLSAVYRREYPGHVIKPVDSRKLEDFYPIGRGIYEFMDNTFAREILEDAPVFPGAVEVLHRWEDTFDIVIATAQPPEGRYPTLSWLGKHRVPANCIHFTYHKHLLEGFALLDDFTDNLENFAASGRLAVCFDQPWNRRWKGPRVNTVEEFFQVVMDHIRETEIDGNILLA